MQAVSSLDRFAQVTSAGTAGAKAAQSGGPLRQAASCLLVVKPPAGSR